MQDANLDHLTLIDELDTQQNALLDQLDELNARIEGVLAALAIPTEELIAFPSKAA